ncbi:DBH-like monooxygenase protein 1 homolog [Watersipora subatra]|uniref:DBH-like monooxygenase protein 1 homolog n=1 Tax=Watersipora subatra TaxID=2589382 RepID=UPI00355B47CC
MEIWMSLLLACCGLTLGDRTSASSAYNELTLDPHEKFNVSWTLDQDSITFTVTCETTGWVGLGFSPSGSMVDADIIVAWVADDGDSYLLDMYATGNTLPTEDTLKDVTLISASEANGVTKVEFRRKLDTCDESGDNIITSSTTHLIYAYRTSDPENNLFSSRDYHEFTNRGTKSVYLLDSKTRSKPSLPDDIQTFDITARNFSVPAEDTIYYCDFQAPPDLDEVHHVVGFEPVITEGNEGLVHHIIMYACYGLTEELVGNYSKIGSLCTAAEMPEFSSFCNAIVMGWAVGGGTVYYPEEVGLPIGGRNGSAASYFQIEIHYDNPGLLDTFVDASGLRFFYTRTLRENELGVIPLGLIHGIAVPPGVEKFRSEAYCDESCTNQWIPEEGINVFSFFLHTHLIGRAIHVEWYRDGQNMGLLAFDDSYDFNFQEMRMMENTHKLLPGDSLKITCYYSSDTRDNVTLGGYSTLSEMCLAFLSYYPRQDLAYCTSFPGIVFPSDPVYDALNLNTSGTGGLAGLRKISNWTSELVSTLQDGIDQTFHFSKCTRENGTPYNLSSHLINPIGYPAGERVEERHCPSDMIKDHQKAAENDVEKSKPAETVEQQNKNSATFNGLCFFSVLPLAFVMLY